MILLFIFVNLFPANKKPAVDHDYGLLLSPHLQAMDFL